MADGALETIARMAVFEAMSLPLFRLKKGSFLEGFLYYRQGGSHGSC